MRWTPGGNLNKKDKDILLKLRNLQQAGAEIAVETAEGILMGKVKHIDAKESILLLDKVTQILGDGQRIEHIAPAIIPFDMIEGISAIT